VMLWNYTGNFRYKIFWIFIPDMHTKSKGSVEGLDCLRLYSLPLNLLYLTRNSYLLCTSWKLY
jgi:hypothetical protein